MEALIEESVKRAIAPLMGEVASMDKYVASMDKDIASIEDDIGRLVKRSSDMDSRTSSIIELMQKVGEEIEKCSTHVKDYFNKFNSNNRVSTVGDDEGMRDADNNAVASVDDGGKYEDIPTEVADMDRSMDDADY
ncbi:hypothetical protein J3F84DRAFT_399444 [Trichoderma pleuroticola]